MNNEIEFFNFEIKKKSLELSKLFEKYSISLEYGIWTDIMTKLCEMDILRKNYKLYVDNFISGYILYTWEK